VLKYSTFLNSKYPASPFEMPKTTECEVRTTTLGGRLTHSRVEKGWTQHQLAAAVGTSQAVIQRIEAGKCNHPRILSELAESLEVSPAWLMFGVNVIEDLEQEAIETARAWSQLMEPQRTALKEMILRIAGSGPDSVPLPEGGVLQTSELLGLR
jgi:transcriptional regulator with XRE-family HTH domain